MGGLSYGIKLKNKDNMFLNNIGCSMGRIIHVNFVNKDNQTVIHFNSKDDAESLAQRIAKQRKLAVETVLM